jgi:hypothetical protein
VTVADELAAMSLEDLRAERSRLQDEDDRVSYVRRAAQARLDLVRAERERRSGAPRDDETDLSGELRRVLSHQLTGQGQGARPPREDRDDLADGPLTAELDQLCADHGFHAVAAGAVGVDDEALDALEHALDDFERRVSSDRRQRFERIDALGSELVRRYRDGEANVDSLLADN